MKKITVTFGLFIFCAAFALAQGLDILVRNAVEELALQTTSPIDIRIGQFLLAGTDTTSDFSKILAHRIYAHAPNTGRFNVVANERNIIRPGEQRFFITGTFIQIGEDVHVTLHKQLFSNQGNRITALSDFSIPAADLRRDGIEILPANIRTHEAAREQERMLSPIPASTPAPPSAPPERTPDPQAGSQAFRIAAWPNSDTYTFFDGDEFRITIEADSDCYFKVYHIDVHNNMQLIFPNAENRNNRLRANVPRTIPDDPLRYNVQAPFGQDTIIVTASTQQFPNLEAEFGQIRQATQAVIGNVTRGRGLEIQVIPGTRPVQTVSTRFNFTSLPATHFDELYSYRRPANMGEAVQAMRSEVIQQGGTFTGNESEGSFTYPGVQGRYWVSGDSVMVSLRYTSNEFTAPPTRGARTPFNFTIDRPRNMAQAIQALRTGIEGKGGSFSGNEHQGNFRASGIAGQYNVAERVNIRIYERPLLIPTSLIEREVRGFFRGM